MIELKGCYQDEERVKNVAALHLMWPRCSNVPIEHNPFASLFQALEGHRFPVGGGSKVELPVEAGARSGVAGGAVSPGLLQNKA